MKGQTQALTAVLITTVTVGAIATAYVWGSPLLEKRQSQANMNQLENRIFSLREEIISVSRGGEGTTSKVSIELDDGRLEIVEKKDIVEIYTRTDISPYPEGTWTMLKGSSLQNLSIGSGSYAIEGEDQPGIVAVKAAPGTSGTVLHYRIEFRNMYSQKPGNDQLSKINIQTADNSVKQGSGDIELTISNVGRTSSRVEVNTGEKLSRTETNIRLRINQ